MPSKRYADLSPAERLAASRKKEMRLSRRRVEAHAPDVELSVAEANALVLLGRDWRLCRRAVKDERRAVVVVGRHLAKHVREAMTVCAKCDRRIAALVGQQIRAWSLAEAERRRASERARRLYRWYWRQVGWDEQIPVIGPGRGGWNALPPDEARRRRNAQRKAWKMANPDRNRAIRKFHKHRLRAMAGDSDITKTDLVNLFRAGSCPVCGVPMTSAVGPAQKQLDHIVPLNVGGRHVLANVRVICRTCNLTRPRDGSDVAVTSWVTAPSNHRGGSAPGGQLRLW